ncbi:hypothetical protein KKF34_05710 [Myxococcota bacterium]|nr:hypothetical protein [Myxococcota bacterium]MBU1379897.1 hypothetical protein [Myxococcota bacterium]MBU1496358.1 hypothetical protein [Myxococcota bacterium]
MKLNQWPVMFILFLMSGSCGEEDQKPRTPPATVRFHNGMTLARLQDNLTNVFQFNIHVENESRLFFFWADIIGNTTTKTKALKDFKTDHTVSREYRKWKIDYESRLAAYKSVAFKIRDEGVRRARLYGKLEAWLYKVRVASEFLHKNGAIPKFIVKRIEEVLHIKIL